MPLPGVVGLAGYLGTLRAGRAVMQGTANRIWPGRPMLEPVVELGVAGRVVGEEMLYRPGWRGFSGCPGSVSHWRQWYRRMCVEHIPRRLGACSGWVALNMHGWQVLDPWILAEVAGLGRYGNRLVVEWTEDARDASYRRRMARYLVRLKAEYGFQLSVDDAGSGSDALERISLVNPDWVKVDGELFVRARWSRESRIAIRALIGVAVELGAKTVVEYVETAEDLDRARSFGAGYGQGWYWGAGAGGGGAETRIQEGGDSEVAAVSARSAGGRGGVSLGDAA